MSDIVKLLSMPEGKTLEFKRDLSSLQPILKPLSVMQPYIPFFQ